MLVRVIGVPVAPDPRIFAGEHTSTHRASMTGALESGLRVAGEARKADGV